MIVRTVNPATLTVSAETVLSAALEVDDHANPSFLVRASDQHILAFYCKHDDTTMRLRIGSGAESIAAFAAEVSLDAQLGGTDYTYPNPIQLIDEANDPIYLFYRDIVTVGQYDLVYGKSTDGGATWAAQVKVADSNAHSYWKIVQNGNGRIDFAYTDEHPAYANGSLYHFYYEGGAYFKSDGTSAGALPLDTTDMTLVYDGTTVPGWVWDIAIGSDGLPRIAYATFPTTADHRYRYARWTGSAWVNAQVTTGGGYIDGIAEPNYSGGIVIDRYDPNHVYVSREVSGQWEIWAYTTNDGGASWTGSAITSGSASKNIRPAFVKDADARLRVLWMLGSYTSYTSWSTGTSGGY